MYPKRIEPICRFIARGKERVKDAEKKKTNSRFNFMRIYIDAVAEAAIKAIQYTNDR